MKLVEAISKRVQNLLDEKGVKQYYLFKNGGIPRSTISGMDVTIGLSLPYIPIV